MTDQVFVDTNDFIASLTDEPERGDVATRFLNTDFEFHTSLLNLMELRSALTKKKRIEQSQVEGVLSDIYANVEVFVHGESEVFDADRIQQETVLYPMDALILAAAENEEMPVVTFDAELVVAGGKTPEELLRESGSG